MSDPTAPTAPLKTTPLHGRHLALGARMVDFGGWHMPIQYEGLKAEHLACRASAGLFDVSHMGEVRLRGPGALAAARRLVCNDLRIEVGRAQYSPMCRPDGGIVDDLIVYHLGPDDVLICVNAANREKDFAWIRENLAGERGLSVEDEGDGWGQVAVQGRAAPGILQALTPCDLGPVPYYGLAQGEVAGVPGCVLARTGYTGEDGFEVFAPAEGIGRIWDALREQGGAALVPVGLGARDTLRLEARMCLYGNDISEETTPLEAQLGWTVKLEDADFIGKAALLRQKAEGVPRRLVGLIVEERIPRPHCPILRDGVVVGEVTSGTRSPSLDQNIALGYVPSALARPGTVVEVDVRGRIASAVVHKGSFYTRPY